MSHYLFSSPTAAIVPKTVSKVLDRNVYANGKYLDKNPEDVGRNDNFRL
jgi:hypothetical protein